jgi:hypothetical protein
MFMGRPHRRAFGISGFWVPAASHDTPRIGAVVDQLARQNRVAGSKEIAGRSRIKAEVTGRTRPDVRTSATPALNWSTSPANSKHWHDKE